MGTQEARDLLRVRIRGLVQGVAFRYATRQEATRLEVGGWVRNCADGSVEASFVGTPEKLDDMLRWCHDGPSLARVESVEVLEREAAGPGSSTTDGSLEVGFEIRY